jgi:uncharacterized protein YciI
MVEPDSPGPPTTREADRLPPMSRYIVGFFRRAPDRPTVSKAEAERIQEGHMSHLRRLAESGAAIVAGPFEEDTSLRGMLVFNFASMERARELTRNDPAILEGRLTLELLTWHAPVGIRVTPGATDPMSPDARSD